MPSQASGRGLRIATEDIPQANKLARLRRIVQCVADGAQTTKELTVSSKWSFRHVRYYLLAARTLEWLELGPRGPAVTAVGRTVLSHKAGSLDEANTIARSISLSVVLNASVGSFLDDDKLEESDIAERLLTSTELAPATASRRAACLVAWRRQLLGRGWRPKQVDAHTGINDLSTRASNVLRRLGIGSVESATRLSEDELLRTRDCGRKTAREILAWSASLGLTSEDEVTSLVANEAPSLGLPESSSVDGLPVQLLLKVSNFTLSVRALNYLERRKIEWVGDLVVLSESALLHGKNCGRKTLNELKVAVGSLGLFLGMNVPAWESADPGDLAKQHSAALARIQQRLHKELHAVDSSAGVNTEVGSAIASVVKRSNQLTVELWLGLDRPAPPTLQRVGDVVGVTRERVRQIVTRAGEKLRAANLDMRKLRAAIRTLEDAGVLPESAALELLRKINLVKGKTRVGGILRAAEVFGVPTTLRLEVLGERKFVGVSVGLAVLKSIQQAGRRAVTRWGCSTLEDVSAVVTGCGRISVTVDLVREVVSTLAGFRWLDEDTGWFWLEDVPRNRLLNKIDKILAVSTKVELTALRAGIARHYRMEGFSPPSRVLRAFCEQLDDCEVVGGRIVVDTRRRLPTDELSEHEQAMLEVFREHGPVLSHAEVRQRCVDASLNDTTTVIYLGNSPIVRRVAVGVYTLVGAAVSPGEVEAVAKTIKQSRRGTIIYDYGWEPDGSGVWVTYKLSAGMLRGGVLSVPAGIKMYITADSYELRGRDSAQIGTIGIGDGTMWGYLPFFRRRGGDVGDYMRVRFRLSDRTVHAETSEEAFEDE